jgi:hypothetical protein
MEEEDDIHLIQILRHLGSAEGEALDECIINEANLMTDECSGRQGESKGVIECSAGEPPQPTGEGTAAGSSTLRSMMPLLLFLFASSDGALCSRYRSL